MTLLTHPTSTRTRTDDELVLQVRAGHPAAFEAVVARYEAPLTAYARNLLGGQHHDAEEAVQDAFVRALGALRKDVQAHREIVLKPWLYAICRNACLDRLRRGAHDRRSVQLELVDATLGDARADPHGRAVGREALAGLVSDLARLPERQREALVSLELEGRSHEQLAEQMDVSVAASKALVCRARRSLVALRAEGALPTAA